MTTHYEIDWHAQWAQHGSNFKDGLVHINFSDLHLVKTPTWRADEIALIPGPGFGDFSHATTRLVLTMMAPHVVNQNVLDMGCGSGVLSVAAYALGATSTHGVDIDPEAVNHARINASKSGSKCDFSLPQKSYPKSSVLVMNMIRSEQSVAIHGVDLTDVQQIFTSGVLTEEKEKYLAQTTSWGWKAVTIKEDSGWLGFHFVL